MLKGENLLLYDSVDQFGCDVTTLKIMPNQDFQISRIIQFIDVYLSKSKKYNDDSAYFRILIATKSGRGEIIAQCSLTSECE